MPPNLAPPAAGAGTANEERNVSKQSAATSSGGGGSKAEPIEEDEEEEDQVRLGQYLHWVKTELDNESACLELPFTIILLLSFSALAYLHLRQSSIFVVEGALRFDIVENANFAWTQNFGHKVIFDVNSLADFWSWFRLGFLPLIIQQSWGYSESMQGGYDFAMPINATVPFDSAELPGARPLDLMGPNSLPIRNDLLHYNRIIGGLRLRQERSTLSWDLCRIPEPASEELWKAWLGKPCMDIHENYELTPEVGHAESFGTPERVEWMMSEIDSLKAMQMMAVDMEDGCSHLQDKIAEIPPDPGGDLVGGDGSCLCTTCDEGTGIMGPWLDEQTRRIEISFVNFNAEHGLYSYVKVNFFFSRGGMIYKFVHVQSAAANIFTGSFIEVVIMCMCDLIWILSLTYILVCEVKEIFWIVRTSKQRWWRALKEDYLAFWNTVDWISIAVAYLLVFLFIRKYRSTITVNSDFREIAETNTTAMAREDYTDMICDFHDSMEELVGNEQLYRMSFMFYPMVVMLRLFKSFDAQPRLAVVTRTLVGATSDMVHFFIIFFSCYFCLSVNAVIIFGQDYEHFCTLQRSVITSFRVLFGDWDYAKMEQVGLLPCAIWFWAFMIILFMILLNILLAILMDAYGEVQSHAANKLTLMKQISEMVRRYRMTQRGDRVKLNDIWKAFFKLIGDEKDMVASEPGPGFQDGVGGREFVTPQIIRNRVMKSMHMDVPMSQARRGCQQARAIEEQKNHQDYTPQHVYDDLERLNILTKDVRDQVHASALTIKEYDFEEDDTEFIRGVPDEPDGDCTEHRMMVADTVKGVVGQLTKEISNTLNKETTMFEKRQRQLEQAQLEMTACAKDACSTLSRLRERTDEVVHELQRQALAKQRLEAAGAASASNIAAAVLQTLAGSGGASLVASCGGPLAKEKPGAI